MLLIERKKKAEDAAANAATSEAGVAGVSTSAVDTKCSYFRYTGSNDVPPPTADGFYRPTPLCETEEIIGEVLGGTINTIMSGFDSAIGYCELMRFKILLEDHLQKLDQKI